MSETPNLQLPYIIAAQAQKHVTHNEAIRALDAVVHLAVLDRGLAVPPGSPSDGDRYIVAAGATGDWSGYEGHVAAYQDGAWMFYAPREGWICWVADEDAALVYDGLTWAALGTGGGGGGGSTTFIGLSDTPANFTGAASKLAKINATATALEFSDSIALLGINATPDATNKLKVASDAILLDHNGTDHRAVVNKNAASDIASFLFQTGYSGRAEIGLTGDDDFHFKVSPDGSVFHEAIVVDKDDGSVTFPNTTFQTSLLSDFDESVDDRVAGLLSAGSNISLTYNDASGTLEIASSGGGGGSGGGSVNPNLLINGDFQINQRAVAGGSLSAGSFGFDRWKAAAGGADVSVSGYTVALASGELEQVVEADLWRLGGFASQSVTVSVEDPAHDLTVTFGSQAGTITAGSGRRSVVLALGAGDTGNLSFKIKKAGSGSTTFGRVKLELGGSATDWQARSVASEFALAQRYFLNLSSPLVGGRGPVGRVSGTSTGTAAFAIAHPAPFRTTPSITINDMTYDNGSYHSATSATVSWSAGIMTGFTLKKGSSTSGFAQMRFASTASYVRFDAEL